MCSIVVALNGFENSTRNTLQADAEARSFWRDTIVTPAADDAREVRDALESSPDVDVVRYADDEISTPDALIPMVNIALITAELQAPEGALIAGNFPSRRDEVAVSEAVADGLGVSIGDRVSIGLGTAETVVGIFPTLADRDELSAVWMTDPQSFEELPAVFFGDRAALDPFFGSQDQLLEIRTTATHFDDDPFRSNARRISGLLGGVAVPVAVLASALLAAAVVAFLRSRQEDINSLVAAGMDQTSAVQVFRNSALLVMLLAMVAGTFSSMLLLRLGSSQLSSLVGQNWAGVSYSWDVALLTLLLVAAIPAGFRYAQRDHNLISRSNVVLSPAVRLLALLVGSAVVVWRSAGDTRLGLAGLAVAVACVAAISLGIPSLVQQLAFRPRGDGERSLKARSGPLSSTATYVACLLAISSIIVGGLVLSEVRALSNSVDLPKSSLALEAVRLDDAEKLAQAYSELDAELSATILPYPSERPGETIFRVANGSASACLETIDSLQSPCVSTIWLSTLAQNPQGADPSSSWRIAPYLDDGSNEIVLIEIDPLTGDIIDLESAPAVADPSLLGNYGVGAVAPTGTTVRETSDSAHVLLSGFTELDLAAQAEFRRQVLSRAGYSQSAAAEMEDYGLLALSWTLAGFGLGLSSLLLVRWADQVWRDETSVPRLLNSVGGRKNASVKRLIRGFAFPQILAVLLSSVLAVPIGRALFGLSNEFFLPYLVMALAIQISTAAITYTLMSRAVDGEARH